VALRSILVHLSSHVCGEQDEHYGRVWIYSLVVRFFSGMAAIHGHPSTSVSWFNFIQSVLNTSKHRVCHVVAHDGFWRVSADNSYIGCGCHDIRGSLVEILC